METPKQLFNTRVNVFPGDPASPSPAAFATKPLNALDRWMGGTRDGHRHATGGTWPDPDSANRCHGARWETSYIPYTCVTCRLHVRLHAIEIVTRQIAPRGAGFRAGGHPDDGRSRFHSADARGWRTGRSPEGTREGAEALRLTGPPGRADRGSAPRNVAARHASRPREAWPPGRPCLAPGERTSPAASTPGTLAGRRHVSAWRTSMRRVEPARSRARRTGSSNAPKAVKPA